MRELLENDVIGKKIVPIIEPVRFNSTYISVIKKFVEKHRNLIIIMNPKVGKFKEEYDTSQANIFNEENEKRKENLKRIISQEGCQLRMNRIIQAEGTFAQVKQNMKFRRFLS